MKRFCCELLSDFVYSFFEHNSALKSIASRSVVNCFQILYIRSLNTILCHPRLHFTCCELLSDFVYSFFEHNRSSVISRLILVVNCFQILYIRSLNTIGIVAIIRTYCCELLSDFVYSFFEHNRSSVISRLILVVNCFQILYIRSLNTI